MSFTVGYRKKGCKTCGPKVVTYEQTSCKPLAIEVPEGMTKQLAITKAENGFIVRNNAQQLVFPDLQTLLAYVGEQFTPAEDPPKK